jgi:hypothetical protein
VLLKLEILDEGLQPLAHDTVAHNPELKVGDSGDSEASRSNQCGKVFDLCQATHKEESEATFSGTPFGGYSLYLVDAVVDACDTAAPRQGCVTEVLASNVTDAYDPVTEEGDNTVRNLGGSVIGRGNEAMTRGDDASNTGEAGANRGLEGRCRIVTMHDIRAGSAKSPQEPQESPSERSFAENVDFDAFCTQYFTERTKITVGPDRNIVAVGTLQPAELGDKNLSATHFETVNNVNYLHG